MLKNILEEIKFPESYVRIPPDDSGKKLRTLEETVGSNTVETYVIALRDDLGNIIAPQGSGSTPAIYNVEMTDADTEYDQLLPSGTKKFLIATEDRSAFRLAFETGKVAGGTRPYFALKTNEYYYEDNVNLTGVTIYFASSDSGKEIVVVAWS
jgi:hypothetical protein